MIKQLHQMLRLMFEEQNEDVEGDDDESTGEC